MEEPIHHFDLKHLPLWLAYKLRNFRQCDAFYSEVQFSKWMHCPKQ